MSQNYLIFTITISNNLYMESKRNYQSPKTEVIEAELNQILCESGINSDE